MQDRQCLSKVLPGTWLLESRIDVTGSGQRHPDPLLGEEPIALLIYDKAGHFSAQFMKRDRSTLEQEAPTAQSTTLRLRVATTPTLARTASTMRKIP